MRAADKQKGSHPHGTQADVGPDCLFRAWLPIQGLTAYSGAGLPKTAVDKPRPGYQPHRHPAAQSLTAPAIQSSGLPVARWDPRSVIDPTCAPRIPKPSARIPAPAVLCVYASMGDIYQLRIRYQREQVTAIFGGDLAGSGDAHR